LRAAVVVQADDFPVEDGVLMAHGVGELLGQLRERQRVPLA
jgi:hypothetical protein